MPYIVTTSRECLDDPIDALANEIPTTPGELNYVLTRLVAAWTAKRGVNYETLALATGVVENVKQELYARIAGPYEDMKMEQNGDIKEFIVLSNTIAKAWKK